LIAYFPDSAALARALPFALFIAALAVRGAIGPDVGAPFDTRWLYATQVLFASAALFWYWRRYGELRHRAARLDHGLMACLAGVAVFALWISLTAPWMRLSEPVASFVPTTTEGTLRWDLVALRAAGAVIVVPLMEELFWRSFLMRWIDKREFVSLSPHKISGFALVASSAVFALAHDLWLAGFIAGLVYGTLYRLTANLWYPIGAHALTNLLLAAWVLHGEHWSFW
jgi:CAAX prenyl protease-like protein